MVAFETTSGPTFDFDASSAGDIDGSGRLASGDETIGATSHALDYSYDRLGQMTAASITNINSQTWTGSYTYHDDGNLDSRTEGGSTQDHSYTGDLLTGVDANNLAWDDNGDMTTGIGVSITRNADGRVQSATSGSNSIDCVYDPEGRMVRKITTIGQSSSTEKYILDVVGDYPVVLMVKDPNTPANNKTYVHANGETLTERVFIYKYFYLHDRLGSVRQLVNTSGNVVNSYTYDPWGNAFPSETSETVDNDIEFANYHWDDTVGMYYLNARWYDPVILRFTGRDPVRGGFREPLTLHAYLYCMNDPLNATDPTGEFLGNMLSNKWGMKMQAAAFSAGSAVMRFAQRVVDVINYRNWMSHLALRGKDALGRGLDVVLRNYRSAARTITGYTRHGLNSAISHDGVGVSPQAILDTTRNPLQVIQQSNGTTKYVGDQAVVVLNEVGEVVTTWATSSQAWRMQP